MKRLFLIPVLIAGLLAPPKAEAGINPYGAGLLAVMAGSAVVTAWITYKAATALIQLGNSGNQTFEGYVPNGRAPSGGCPSGDINDQLAQVAANLWFVNCSAILAFHLGACSTPPSIASQDDPSICMSPAIIPGLGETGCARATIYSNNLYPGHGSC